MADNGRCLRSWRSAKPGEVRHEHTREIVVREEKLAEGFAELLDALASRVAELEEHRSSLDLVHINSPVPSEYEQQIGFMVKTLHSYESRLIAVEARVDEVEARPHLSEATVRELMQGINTRFHDKIKELVAASNGDMRSQITTLKSTAVTRQEPASDQLAKLSRLIDSVGDYVKTFEQTVEEQNTALEEKYAAIAAHLQQTNGDVLKVKTMVYRLAAAVREPEDA